MLNAEQIDALWAYVIPGRKRRLATLTLVRRFVAA
jgi:hypothetical protein